MEQAGGIGELVNAPGLGKEAVGGQLISTCQLLDQHL